MDRVSEEDEDAITEDIIDTDNPDDDPENDDGSSEIATGTGCLTQPEPEMREEQSRLDMETEVDLVQEPIPFQKGVTRQSETSHQETNSRIGMKRLLFRKPEARLTWVQHRRQKQL